MIDPVYEAATILTIKGVNIMIYYWNNYILINIFYIYFGSKLKCFDPINILCTSGQDESIADFKSKRVKVRKK